MTLGRVIDTICAGRGGHYGSDPLFAKPAYRGNVSLGYYNDGFAVRFVRRVS